MRVMSMRAWAMTLLATASLAGPLSAQDVTSLLGEGRYEEAVALLADVSPETAYVGAEMVFERAHSVDFESGEYESAMRGFIAGKRIPHMNERQRQRFEFWHGATLVAIVRRDLEADLEAAEAIPMLEEAYVLLVSARDYASGINQVSMAINVARLIDELSARR
jgi:hypothetical protein